MTTSNYITFILLGVIGLVFLIDFILNSRKKPLEKSVEKFVEKEKSEGKSSLKWLNWILDRKKNLTLSVLLISILKLLTHWYIYRNGSTDFPTKESDELELASGDYSNIFDPLEVRQEEWECTDCFAWHLENIYIDTIWLFIPVSLVFLVVVWFFNDKIKSR